MRALILIVAFTVVGAARAGTTGFAIREETEREAMLLQASSNIQAGETARDYSGYFGKTLAEIGAGAELVVSRPSAAGLRTFSRPDDATILYSITELTLQPFPLKASFKDYRKGRSVTGKLKDGRHFSVLFIEGTAVEASIEINRETVVRFALQKRPGPAPEPTPSAAGQPSRQPSGMAGPQPFGKS